MIKDSNFIKVNGNLVQLRFDRRIFVGENQFKNQNKLKSCFDNFDKLYHAVFFCMDERNESVTFHSFGNIHSFIISDQFNEMCYCLGVDYDNVYIRIKNVGIFSIWNDIKPKNIKINSVYKKRNEYYGLAESSCFEIISFCVRYKNEKIYFDFDIQDYRDRNAYIKFVDALKELDPKHEVFDSNLCRRKMKNYFLEFMLEKTKEYIRVYKG